MCVLIIKNEETEGPGNMLEFLKKINMHFLLVDAFRERSLPDANLFQFIVVLGGPMGVYDMNKYPFLKEVAYCIEKALINGKSVLGVCLGAQLLAHVLGSEVYYSGEEEIGWCEIELTEEGMRDPCFGKLCDHINTMEVLQWHGDTFDLPQGAKRLAFSDRFLNQAFSYRGSYGFQFHIEVTPSMIKDWFKERHDFNIVFEKTEKIYPLYREKAQRFYEAFFKTNISERRYFSWKNLGTNKMCSNL